MLLKEYITDHVISRDGIKIGYRQLGTGPGLILVHGGMMYSQNFMELATCLSDKFTVYVPDRQGRGLSDARENHGLIAEAEDIRALALKTNTQNIFGLSSGAIVSLQTAIITPEIKKTALFEPPLAVDGIEHTAWYPKYERAVAKENWGKAFVNILKAVDDSSSLFSLLPSFITAPLMNLAIKKQEKGAKAGDVSLRSLIDAFRYDYTIAKGSTDLINKCKDLQCETLLLSGTKSREYLIAITDKLNTALPKAKRITFPGLGHTAANNGDAPKIVAEALKSFLT